jgi:DMSO/TMAO reductase YedYZ molybdopterin-dependent catalytic subunit
MAEQREQIEAEMQAKGRLPPGQSVTLKFPVLHYGPVPIFDPATWDFRIFGDVEQGVGWNWEQFQALPRTNISMDIHCVTRWSKFNTHWEGVAIKTLIDEGLINIKPQAEYILQHCEYGYTTNIPLELALGENFLLATHFNGEAITPDHGYPLRGVIGAIPGRSDLKDIYLWKGGKWLRGLEFMSSDRPGFWEQAGYHNDADVWKEERFSGR